MRLELTLENKLLESRGCSLPAGAMSGDTALPSLLALIFLQILLNRDRDESGDGSRGC